MFWHNEGFGFTVRHSNSHAKNVRLAEAFGQNRWKQRELLAGPFRSSVRTECGNRELRVRAVQYQNLLRLLEGDWIALDHLLRLRLGRVLLVNRLDRQREVARLVTTA